MFWAVGDKIVGNWDAEDKIVVPWALECSDVVLEALRYLASSIFNSFHWLIENSQLYRLRDKGLGGYMEVIKWRLERGTLLVVFQDLSVQMMEVLGEKRLQRPTAKVVEFVRNREFLFQVVASNTFSTGQEIFQQSLMMFFKMRHWGLSKVWSGNSRVMSVC